MTHIVPGIRPGTLLWPALFGLVLFGSVAPRGVWSQTLDSQAPPPSETKVNPFSGFETHYLSNGLKVWFKRLPEATNVSISLGVPYGSDQDPRRKEELAHLTEHILFSDHDGRTEQEINDAIDAIGGRRNGFTTPDHTWYYVTVSKEHGRFALEWLSRVISPHAMDADVVERNRIPVAVEINAQPREFLESVWALLNPSWLLPSDFWRREFQMRTRDGRRYDRWGSLQRITPEDVADFYHRYYVPEAMTLTVIGDLDRSEVLEISERTLGSLDQRPVSARAMAVEDPNRRRATSYWGFGPNVRYTARHKLFDSDAEDDLMVLFIRDLLRRRLNQRLRYGEQKAVYGLQVSTTQRGPGGFLQIQGSIAEDEYDFAQAIIQEEIAALREGTLPPEEFEADRTALVERLRGENSTAQALNFWVLRNFYDPSKHTDFPDLLSFFAGVTQDEVAAFAARTFVPEREVTTVIGVQPMSQGMLATAALVLVFLTVRAVAWTLTRPVTMPGILYVARFRMPVLLLIGAVVGFGGVGLIVGRLIVFVVQSLALAYLVTIDHYGIQLVFYGAMLITAVVLSILYLSRFPRKLIVFPDHLRIKFLAYRSRIIQPDDLLEISTRRINQGLVQEGAVPVCTARVGPGRPGNLPAANQGKGLFLPHEKHRGADRCAGRMARIVGVTGPTQEGTVGFRQGPLPGGAGYIGLDLFDRPGTRSRRTRSHWLPSRRTPSRKSRSHRLRSPRTRSRRTRSHPLRSLRFSWARSRRTTGHRFRSSRTRSRSRRFRSLRSLRTRSPMMREGRSTTTTSG